MKILLREREDRFAKVRKLFGESVKIVLRKCENCFASVRKLLCESAKIVSRMCENCLVVFSSALFFFLFSNNCNMFHGMQYSDPSQHYFKNTPEASGDFPHMSDKFIFRQ